MNNKLKVIYQKLYSYFGPQHWWPADSPFEVMVGAILTQNTNWTNVEKAIDNLKKNKLLTPDVLFRISHKRLALLIRPAGYYNIKAKRLKEFLQFLFKVCQGSLKKMSQVDTLTLRKKLLSVNGIGPETADSILLYALDKPVFVVDAYTKRILLRHHLIKEDYGYGEIQNLFTPHLWTHSRTIKTEYSKGAGFMQNLNPVTNIKTKHRKNTICNGVKNDVKLFNEYHALLVKLGKEFCLKKRPKCEICPLKG